MKSLRTISKLLINILCLRYQLVKITEQCRPDREQPPWTNLHRLCVDCSRRVSVTSCLPVNLFITKHTCLSALKVVYLKVPYNTDIYKYTYKLHQDNVCKFTKSPLYNAFDMK